MAKAFSTDLRQRVIAASQAKHTNAQIARSLQVSEPWVHKVLAHFKATGEIEPCRKSPGRKLKLAADQDRIQAAIQAKPDATLEELCQTLRLDVDLSTLCRMLKKLKITFKKSPDRGRTKTA